MWSDGNVLWNEFVTDLIVYQSLYFNSTSRFLNRSGLLSSEKSLSRSNWVVLAGLSPSQLLRVIRTGPLRSDVADALGIHVVQGKKTDPLIT